ncbi:Hsp20/alpha crystallin family protein [Ruania albidiflava]|uniref:Hsp20/alpha crystallin family protein n=1 Tax=Ruania albidiflava TaxID=366586 RepID=UPI0023F0FEEC|nr:Hsp20/alpha crystallin family protein [Ruania albidiflava]
MSRIIARTEPLLGLEALRRDLFDDGFFRSLRRVSMPTTDVYTEDDQALVVESHLPNFAETDVTVNVDGDQLVIQAERHEREEDKKKYVVRESSSSFYRSVTLPDQAQQDAITAGFANGVLKVTVPLARAATPRAIPISSDA